jgi:glycosyltransferase involved in cell wall biosynthesis
VRLALEARGHDLVHVHASRALGLAVLACGRKPIVYTRRVDFTPGRDPLSRLKYAQADSVVCLSRRIAEVLREWGFPGTRLRVIPSAVPAYVRPDLERIASLRAEFGLGPGAPVIGHIGALVGHKDQETLLVAARRVLDRRPEVRFVLVGDGPLRRPLHALARRLSLGDSVVFTGFRGDALDFYSLFDLFCLSSNLEGLGSAVLDAFAAGVPVVATSAGGIPEVVEDGVSGRMVPPGDPAALADALVGALEDAPARARWTEAARVRAAGEFSMDRMVEAYRGVYAEMAG